MGDLEDFIDKEKKETEEKERMIEKCKEFLEANDYEVHTKGAYCSSVAEDREYQANKPKYKW